jgi:glycosyltransferase involved in cell wall biosynthesis
MSAALPVVASDFPLWREIVQGSRCGLLADPLNPMSIAASIRQILQDPKLADRMGSSGRLAVQEKYNWMPEGKKLLAAYEGLKR